MNELINEIKKELHANMNGIASAHMRQTEDYRLNWGIELPRLANMADEIAHSGDFIGPNASEETLRQLAQALWHEQVRECKILACMLMPPAAFAEDLCDMWVDSIHTEEIASIFCLHVVKRLPYVSKKAFEWMASERPILQTCGFMCLCHLLREHELSESAEAEFLDQAEASSDNRYALKALQIYAALGKEQARKVKKIADFL